MPFVKGHDDVVAVIDAGSGRSDTVQCAHDHLRMFVACECRSRGDHAVVEIALVVKDGTTARPSSDVECIFGVVVGVDSVLRGSAVIM